MTDDADATQKKRMGRPPKPAGDVKRHGIAFRVNDRLRNLIHHSAEDNQRSVAEEVEYRLQLSASISSVLDGMASDRVTLQLFRTLSRVLRSVRSFAKRAGLNENDTRIALAAAFRFVSEVNFWTGGDISPPPDGYIGNMDHPPRKKHELPPAAMGYSIASDIMLSDSIWEECAVMDDFNEIISDHWSGDGTKMVDASSAARPEPLSRSLQDIMAEVNPRDKKSKKGT